MVEELAQLKERDFLSISICDAMEETSNFFLVAVK